MCQLDRDYSASCFEFCFFFFFCALFLSCCCFAMKRSCAARRASFDRPSGKVFKSKYGPAYSSSHSGSMTVTVRMYGCVVRTNSLKITQSGAAVNPQDGCRATIYRVQLVSTEQKVWVHTMIYILDYPSRSSIHLPGPGEQLA